MQKSSVTNILDRISPKNPSLRSEWVNMYTRLITIAGFAVVVYAAHHLPQNTGGLWLFILLGVLSELTSIQLFSNSRSTVSMSSIIAIASILAIDPLAGVFTYLASGLTTAITTTLQSIKSPHGRASLAQRTSFNAAMWSIAAAVAGAVYVLTGGKPAAGTDITVIPLILSAVSEWVINVAIVIIVISLQTGQSPVAIWNRDIRWQAPVSITAGIIGGGFLAVAYSMFGMFGLMIVLLPILSTSYSFRAYKNNMQGYVEGLENLNENLKDALLALETSNQDLCSANEAVRRLNAELFQSLARVFDMRDPYVGGHAAQVAVYAVTVATELGLAPERIELIRQAAYLHDIGKLSIPEAILHKPGKLTEIEYGFVKKHTDIGADLLASVEGLKHLAPFVRHHHERWDGHGYPASLAGEQIPLEARILNVCDSVESMASDRPYHGALTVKAIIEELQRCAGTQFDPAVAESFVSLMSRQSVEPFIVNSARSVTQQYAASILAKESLTQSMFAWVFEKEARG
jgi:putative nucleotidyltransferase with HDIG domain